MPAPALAVTYQHQTRSSHRVVHKRVVYRRSKKKSLAIVARQRGDRSVNRRHGGRRGRAGIGAVAGGASGFIYDRLTHKKTIYVQ